MTNHWEQAAAAKLPQRVPRNGRLSRNLIEADTLQAFKIPYRVDHVSTTAAKLAKNVTIRRVQSDNKDRIVKTMCCSMDVRRGSSRFWNAILKN